MKIRILCLIILYILLDELQLSNQRMTGRKMNTTSGNNETVSGNAMFVNVHNSNETLKTTQGDPTASTPYHSLANKDQKGPSPDYSDKTSTTNINTIPSNAKTEASMMASSIPAMSTYSKSSIPQDANRRESNMSDNRTSSESFNVNYKSNMNDTMNIHPQVNANDTKNETKSYNELKDKHDPLSLNLVCSKDTTDKSGEVDNHLVKETVKSGGATDHGVEALVNASQASVMPNKLPMQSQNTFSKPNAHQNSFDESNQKVDGTDIRKNIDSTLKSNFPSHTSKSVSLDNKSEGEISSSSAKSLASLDKEIAEKKAKAMLPIQKNSSIPPKTTSSLFGGSGSLFKAGGSKFMDGLLKQAEARAAKEASEAAASASTKNSDSKQELPKEILLPSINAGTRLESEAAMNSKTDIEKGKTL